MQIKSKYKIARRLGPEIFDKTQTQKFALRQSQRNDKPAFKGRAKSDFGRQLLEKQKARFTYGVGERQFARYVENSLKHRTGGAENSLLETLETRLDNVVYRMGLAPSRLAARQMVAHGHFLVNGKRVTIPSYNVKVTDKVKIRVASQTSLLFANLEEKLKEKTFPTWLKFDPVAREGSITARPTLSKGELTFDISAILEYYRR